MKKITSIFFTIIFFSPLNSFAISTVNQYNPLNSMNGGLYTSQTNHAPDTSKYDELKKTITECVTTAKSKNKTAPENYITSRATKLKNNTLTRPINYTTYIQFGTSDRNPKKFSCSANVQVNKKISDNVKIQKVAAGINNIPESQAKTKCIEEIAKMAATDDWYVSGCITNKIKKNYNLNDVDDYYNQIYSPYGSANKTQIKKSNQQAIEPEIASAPVFNSGSNSASAFSNTPSMVSNDATEREKFQEEIAKPNQEAIDWCKRSGGDWENNKCNCEKYGMEYDKTKLRCIASEIPHLEQRSATIDNQTITPTQGQASKIESNDATTLITVSVIDNYNSNKKIKGIKICYTNTESCNTTNKDGKITFTHNHIATEKISPKLTVESSSDYHCESPVDISNNDIKVPNLTLGSEGYQTKSTTDKKNFNFVVKCKQKCTDKDLKKVPNAAACYVRDKNDYEIIRCNKNHTNVNNKCEPDTTITARKATINTTTPIEIKNSQILDDSIALEEESELLSNEFTCKNSKSNPKPTWDGLECVCPNQEHVFNYSTGQCEELKTSDELCAESGGKWQKNKANCNCPKNKPYNSTTRKCEETNLSDLCTKSGGTWNGKKCDCDKNKLLTKNKETQICECTNSTYTYNSKSKRCTQTAQDKAIQTEFEKEVRISRQEKNCIDSGGTYDEVILANNQKSGAHICNCKTGQTYNTKTELCECNETGHIYSQSEKQCIALDITMEDYKEIETFFNTKLTELKELLDEKCSDQEPQPQICDKQNNLIEAIEKLNKDSLEELKKHRNKQFEKSEENKH